MAENKTCKCGNCGATIDVETGKTFFKDGEIDRVAQLEKKVKDLARLAGKNSRKPKGDKPNVDQSPKKENREGSEESDGGLLPF
jgi:hypothetical protein